MATLSMADIRWRARRDPGGGPPIFSVMFLTEHDRRATAAAAGVRDYLAGLAGRRRAEYDPDVVVAIAGERRLGHGLAAGCFDFYAWTARTLAEELGEERARHLTDAGIDTPSGLRLRLFDQVNQHDGGYVPSGRRDEALARLARSLGLAGEDGPALDAALRLDAEEEALLAPPETAPSVVEVLARYNRAALATVLRQSERIVFTLHQPAGGTIRRLYAWCRRLGVYADIERAGLETDVLRLTLAGPDAVSAAPASTGPRLALVALRLLRALGTHDTAAAHLHVNERPYRLLLTRVLLDVPGLALTARDRDIDSPAYDSQVEEALAAAFAALQRQGRAAGWRLVREPAPLLAGRRVIIPDFALDRGGLRVYLEIAGFWTPGYLAKKRAALAQLPADTRLIIAVPDGSLPAFADLPFPLVAYREAMAPQPVLDAAARFDALAARTAGGAERLRAACAASAGWLALRELGPLLGCYTDGEVAQALAAAPPPPGWQDIPGAGLCSTALRNRLSTALSVHWQEAGEGARLTLAGVRALGVSPLPETDEALLALLATLPACRLAHESLFEPAVLPRESAVSEPADRLQRPVEVAATPPPRSRPRRTTARAPALF